MSFDGAELFCNNYGGTVYGPRDENAMKLVLDHAKVENITEFWLGIHDKVVEGKFVYASDNLPINYDNWKEGEPNNHEDMEDCVSVNTANGFWNDIDCTKEQKSIVCVK